MSDVNKSLRLVYLDTNSAGKTVRKTRTYSDVIIEASNENCKKAAQAIDGLCAERMTYVELVTNERLN